MASIGNNTDTSSTDNPEDDQAVLHSRRFPRTLQELTSMKVAFCIKFLDYDADVLNPVSSWIRDMIESTFQPIEQELDLCFEALKNVLCCSGTEDIRRWRRLVVLRGIGRINFKATIANILENDDTLGDLTRFELACVGCLKETADVLWPLIRDWLCIEYLGYKSDLFESYKIRGMQDGPYEGINSFGTPAWTRISSYTSALQTMKNSCSMYNECKLNYRSTPLWRGLERIVKNDFLFLTERKWQTIELFKPHCIDKQFILDSSQLRSTIQHRNFLSCGDAEAEKKLHTSILSHIALRNTDEKGDPFQYIYTEKVLAHGWSTALPYLKNTILEKHLLDMLQQISTYRGDLTKHFGRDISFVIALLSDADTEFRNSYWSENWQKWIVGVPPFQFEKLTRICLQSSEVIQRFKSTLKDTSEFGDYVNILATRGHHQELNEIVSTLYPDDDVWNIKRHVLQTNWKQALFSSSDIDALHKYSKFVDDFFSNDHQAKNFKEELILSEDCFDMFYKKMDCNDLLSIQIIVELFSTTGRKVQVTSKFLEHFRAKVGKGELYGFDSTNWKGFLGWCLDHDEAQIENFKNSLQIVGIFQEAFRNCLQYERDGSRCRFEDLDEFLRWYFKWEWKSRKFISERVEFYREMDGAYVYRIFGMDKESVIESLGREMPADTCLDDEWALMEDSRSDEDDDDDGDEDE